MDSLDLNQPRLKPSLITIFILVAALYLGRELLIPFALAFLLAPILTPLVEWLERCRLGRIPAVVIVMALTCAMLGVTAWFLTQQMTELVARLPEYKAQIIAKAGSFRGGMIEIRLQGKSHLIRALTQTRLDALHQTLDADGLHACRRAPALDA